MKVLICNTGSTSLKFKLYDMPDCTVLAQCHIERVGSKDDAVLRYQNKQSGHQVEQTNLNIADYRSGIELFLQLLTTGEAAALSSITQVERVGYKATLSKGYLGIHEITDEVLQGMHDWISLAPLHNRAYIDTIGAMQEVLPHARAVAAFETSFHRDIPPANKLFAVPYEWYEKYGVQRLGYHSASHGYIADVLNAEKTRYAAISCHLGGSCSLCAILDGKSINTSFGMSLESGIPHANRIGDMDPSIAYFLREEGLSDEEILYGFQKNGGLLGISGVSNDLRYIIEAANEGHERAKLAIDVFVSSIVHYIGAFYLDLGRLDNLVFTAGIGEHSGLIRAMVCEKLTPLGVRLDTAKNSRCRGEGIISAADSAVTVRVIPTDEELGIARRVYSL